VLPKRTVVAAIAALVLAGSSAGVLAENLREPAVSRFSFFDGWDPGEPYGLDGERRHLEEDEKVECAADQMVRHRSKALRYSVTAHPEFVVRLERFEAFVIALATEHYGRAPRKLVHKGVFACRTLRSRSERISEHALGNALDFQGLDFGPLPRKAQAPEALPRQLRRAFSMRVLKHWTPKREVDAHHARFLHRLVEELRLRPDIFRGIVGPPRPRHLDHLHFDAAPWRYAMYQFDEPS
jgi:hypothetical protein